MKFLLFLDVVLNWCDRSRATKAAQFLCKSVVLQRASAISTHAVAPLSYQPYALVHTAFFLISAEDLRANRAAETMTHREGRINHSQHFQFIIKAVFISVKNVVCSCECVMSMQEDRHTVRFSIQPDTDVYVYLTMSPCQNNTNITDSSHVDIF